MRTLKRCDRFSKKLSLIMRFHTYLLEVYCSGYQLLEKDWSDLIWVRSQVEMLTLLAILLITMPSSSQDVPLRASVNFLSQQQETLHVFFCIINVLNVLWMELFFIWSAPWLTCPGSIDGFIGGINIQAEGCRSGPADLGYRFIPDRV